MRCERFREAVSARLDDEPLGMSPSVLDSHLSSCPDCARWAEDAAVVTRQARLDVTPVPDLTDVVTAGIALPAHRVLRRRHWLRVLLGVIGVAQLGIGLPAIFGDELGMAMGSHGAHEGAAWNLAIGVAFLAAASVPRRATGLVPLLATFTVVLLALSVHDIAAGAVTLARVATHAAVVAGLLVLLLLDRAERALPPGGFVSGRGRRRDRTDRDDDGRPGLRSVA